MDGVVVGLSGVALLLAILAYRRTATLAESLRQATRERAVAEAKVQLMSHKGQEELTILRRHVAELASGHPVPSDLILAGRSFRVVTAEDLRRYVDARSTGERAHILDVRTTEEYRVKHVPQATQLAYEELAARHAQDVSRSWDRLYVYCDTGERSRLACEYLSGQGYFNLYDVTDGLRSWKGPFEGEGAVTLVQIQRKSHGR
jgi:rhodanese-related sulfurtransferase